MVKISSSSLFNGRLAFMDLTFSRSSLLQVILPLNAPVSTLNKFLGSRGKHTETAPEAT